MIEKEFGSKLQTSMIQSCVCTSSLLDVYDYSAVSAIAKFILLLQISLTLCIQNLISFHLLTAATDTCRMQTSILTWSSRVFLEEYLDSRAAFLVGKLFRTLGPNFCMLH